MQLSNACHNLLLTSKRMFLSDNRVVVRYVRALSWFCKAYNLLVPLAVGIFLHQQLVGS